MHHTPLYEWHLKHGGRLGRFGDFQLPLWYGAGVKAEQMAVLETAGLFDTCHMSPVMVEGEDSFRLLQNCFSRDLSICLHGGRPLIPGRGVYGVFLKPNGHLLDDAIVYQLAPDAYLVCVNSGMGQKVSNHLESHDKWSKRSIADLSSKLAKIDLQGPLSGFILAKVLQEPDKVLKNFPYFACKGHFNASSPLAAHVRLLSGRPILLCRSGYTGEFGFEMFILPEYVVDLWREILVAGQEHGIQACGLAARDSLRAGAVLPLAGQDIGDWPFVNNPWTFVLPFKKGGKGFTKTFTGDQALLQAKHDKFTYPFAGFDPRKVEAGTDSMVLDMNGRHIGTVLTCVTAVGIDRVHNRLVNTRSQELPADCKPRGISCGFVKVDMRLPHGAVVCLKDKRREIMAEIVADIRPHRTATKER